jgi:hypothetical protein
MYYVGLGVKGVVSAAYVHEYLKDTKRKTSRHLITFSIEEM